MRKNVLSMFAATLSCSLMLTSCLDVFDNPSVNINEESEFSSMMDLGTYLAMTSTSMCWVHGLPTIPFQQKMGLNLSARWMSRRY